MSIIGFLTYQDFLIELKETSAAQSQQVVRVQDYSIAEYSSPQPDIGRVVRIKFYVLIGLDTGQDVLVCRMCTGSEFKYNRENVNRLERRNTRAAWFVKKSLQGLGFETRPGIIAASQETKTEAKPGNLWNTRDLDTKEFEERLAQYGHTTT
jgi:hypothetical protein